MYLIAVILVAILLFVTYSRSNDEIINGFWTISDDFKKQADLDQMVFYFDGGCGYDYDGYVLIATGGKIVHNEPAKFKITPKGYFKSNTYTCTIEDCIDFMPQTLTMTINPQRGSMELKQDNVLYALLFRDNITSSSTVLRHEKN